ncbi:MAG: hypothetical protein NZM10_06180 [Fimbriimonadales bacterium]|nr:hypothetical protein [Fimbriimonadales bacterium]
MSTRSSAGRRRDGLDTTTQATLCLGETPKPHRRWDADTTQQGLHNL